MEVPTDSDWRSEPWCLDAEQAYRNFFGKTTVEAIRLFEENSLRYQEDVMFMPRRVFGYYLAAYISYLLSDASQDDAGGANAFIYLIDFKSEAQPDDIKPLWNDIEPVLKRLAENQDFYGADWLPYRSFRTRIHGIVERGFPVSFDTTASEIVPADVTWDLMTFVKPCDNFPWSVALQIFRNAGFTGIDASSIRSDILRFFGPTVASGGNRVSENGWIPEWIQCQIRECLIRFEFDGETITGVMFQSWDDFPTLDRRKSI